MPNTDRIIIRHGGESSETYERADDETKQESQKNSCTRCDYTSQDSIHTLHLCKLATTKGKHEIRQPCANKVLGFSSNGNIQEFSLDNPEVLDLICGIEEKRTSMKQSNMSSRLRRKGSRKRKKRMDIGTVSATSKMKLVGPMQQTTKMRL